MPSPILPAIAYNIAGGAATALSTKPALLVAVMCTAAGAAARVDVFDNTAAASGNLLCKLQAPANTTTIWTPAIPIRAFDGIYAGVNGAGAVGIIVLA